MGIEQVGLGLAAGLDKVAGFISKSKKIIAITGAGISTNCGIPDFRSQNGLYSLIKRDYDTQSTKEQVPIKGKDLFDSSLWKSEYSTKVFYQFIASLNQKIRDDGVNPSTAHRFLATLRNNRKLVRVYTQNIDGLEVGAGMTTDMELGTGSKRRFVKTVVESSPNAMSGLRGSDSYNGCEVVQLHGELDTLRCSHCKEICGWGDNNEHEETFLGGMAPLCQTCVDKDEARRSQGRRGLPVGSLRPNIVLYGEENPAADSIGEFIERDIAIKPDLLLIFGTSLKVHGLKNVVKQLANAIHSVKKNRGKVIFINLTEPATSVWDDVIDFWVKADCDEFVDELRQQHPNIFLTQKELKLQTAAKKASLLDNKKFAEATGEVATTKETIEKPARKRGRPAKEKKDLAELKTAESKANGKRKRVDIEAEALEKDRASIVETTTSLKKVKRAKIVHSDTNLSKAPTKFGGASLRDAIVISDSPPQYPPKTRTEATMATCSPILAQNQTSLDEKENLGDSIILNTSTSSTKPEVREKAAPTMSTDEMVQQLIDEEKQKISKSTVPNRPSQPKTPRHMKAVDLWNSPLKRPSKRPLQELDSTIQTSPSKRVALADYNNGSPKKVKKVAASVKDKYNASPKKRAVVKVPKAA